MSVNEDKDGMEVNLEDKEETGESEPEFTDSHSMVGQRMTIAGGFLDVALFVADVEHLKFILDTGRKDIEYYDILLALLFTDLSLQIVVGILLFISGFSKKSNQTEKEAKWTRILNHVIVGIVSLIAIINIFITVFGDRTETIHQYKTRHLCTDISE